MNRIALFLATNMAILLVLSISMSIFGIEGVLDEQGVDLNLSSLLFISSVIGFAGDGAFWYFYVDGKEKHGRSDNCKS